MDYNNNWSNEISGVDVVDKKGKDIIGVKEVDIRNIAIEYLNKEENRRLPPHEFNLLVSRVKEYLTRVDNERSQIEHKFEGLRRGIVAEIRASKNTLRREIDSRNIDEISKIRNPGDLSRYIDQSGDKALIILKKELGTENILSLAGLGLSYGTIELGRGLADVLKLGEEFVKAYDDLKNGDFMAKDKIKLIFKTLGIEGLRLLCVMPFGRLIVGRMKIFFHEGGSLGKKEKIVLAGQELFDRYRETIELGEKVLGKGKLNFKEKNVIIKAHEIGVPIDGKYDYKDIDKKYRLLRTVFDENQSRKLIESGVCGKNGSLAEKVDINKKKLFFDKLTPKKQEVLLKTDFGLPSSLDKINLYIREGETAKLKVEIGKVLNKTEILADYMRINGVNNENVRLVNTSLENLNRILENKTVLKLIKEEPTKYILWKDILGDLRRELRILTNNNINVTSDSYDSFITLKNIFDNNWNNLISKNF